MADVSMEEPIASSSKLASPPVKRKAEELAPTSSDIVITGEKTVGKKRKVEPKKKPTLAKLQGAKFSLLQKPIPSLLSGSTATLKDLINWQTFYSALSEPLDDLPEQFHGLVVRLCQESEKPSSTLAKEVRSKLIPQDLEDTSNLDALTVSYIETLIYSLLTRTNYGLTPPDIDLPSTTKLPAGFAVWRWEVIDRARYLPSEVLPQLETRIEERVKAKVEVLAIWNGLSSSERDALLSKTAKGKERAKSVSVEPEGCPPNKSPSKSPVKESKPKPKKEKVLNPEAAAKKAERDQKELEKDERRAIREAKAKEKEDKEKKAEESKKQQKASMFAWVKKAPVPAQQPILPSVASSSTSDYQRTFLPFVEKKDTILAPINRLNVYKAGKANGKGKEREKSTDDLDRETCEMWTPKDLLRHFVRSVPPEQLPRPAKYSQPGIKSGPFGLSVREVVQQSQEAELSGTGDPRKITESLKDERLYRRKFLKFREDQRPPYYGTWTQSSRVVGPRTPFARDINLFDYNYDSADDWEEDDIDGEDLDTLDSPKRKRRNSSTPAGGGTSVSGDMWDTDEDDGDFGTDEEEEEDDASDAGGEDSWMVDEVEETADGESRGASPVKEELPESAFAPMKGRELDKIPAVKPKPIKVKIARQKGWGKKKKKLDVKGLVPLIRGPFFEKELGVCEWAGFESYRIQTLNDTPFPIDPFTFVAMRVKADPPPPPQLNAVASSVPRRVSDMPPPPNPSSSSHTASTPAVKRTLPSSSSHSGLSPSQAKASPSTASTSTPKAAPKNPFPSACLREFLIDVSRATTPVVTLVAELYQKWKPHGVQKVQIEYELRRRAKRQGRADGSPWVILEDGWKDVPGGKPA